MTFYTIGYGTDWQHITFGPGVDTVDMTGLTNTASLDFSDLNAGITASFDLTQNTGFVDKGANGTVSFINPSDSDEEPWSGTFLYGTAHDDTFTIVADDNDYFEIAPGTGNDTFDLTPNTGDIVLDYSLLQTGEGYGVIADFPNGTIQKLDGAFTDDISGHPNILLTTYGDDTVISDGDDMLVWLLAGTDSFTGGAGWDEVAYHRIDITEGLEIDLNVGVVTGTWDDLPFEHTLIGIDEVWGSRHNDTITGTEASEDLGGGDGNDSIVGGGGDDTLDGDAGHDTLIGGAGNDTAYGNAGWDLIETGDGDDSIYGGEAQDTINAGDGDDVIDSTDDDPATMSWGDWVNPGRGNDTIIGSQDLFDEAIGLLLTYRGIDVGGLEIAVGPGGTGTATGGNGQVNTQFSQVAGVFGSDGDDTIDIDLDGKWGLVATTPGDDQITLTGTNSGLWLGHDNDGIGVSVDLASGIVVDQFGSTDTVSGIGGIYAGNGDDSLSGAGLTQDLSLWAYGGDDTLVGAVGEDFLDAGAGNDLILPGATTDHDIVWDDDATGNDTIDYVGAAQSTGRAEQILSMQGLPAVTVDLIDPTQDILLHKGETGTILLKNLDEVVSSGVFELYTGTGDDHITLGHAFDDAILLELGAGQNRVELGTGQDPTGIALSYVNSEVRVEIDIAARTFALADGSGEDSLDDGILVNELFGSGHDDRLFGSDRDEIFHIHQGNDRVHGRGGIDTLSFERLGVDSVQVHLHSEYAKSERNGTVGSHQISGIENVIGTDGDDILVGDDNDNRLVSGPGQDTLIGGGGNDTLESTGNRATLVGGGGSDIAIIETFGLTPLVALGYYNELAYKLHSDEFTILIDSSVERVVLGGEIYKYNDLSKEFAPYVILPTPGDDTLEGTSQRDTVDLLAGDDTFFANLGNDSILGNLGDDVLYGWEGNDTLIGGAGHDILNGWSGHDRLIGGAGNDSLWGGEGDDRIDGGPGADLLQGHFGTNTLLSGEGADTVIGGAGSDTIDAGPGDDQIFAFGLGDKVDGGDGHDRIEGSGGPDRLVGGAGNDTLEGDEGDDFVDGGAGDDDLSGGAGDDTLIGGDGDDTLRADGGSDELQGGAGVDRVVIDDASTEVSLQINTSSFSDIMIHTRDGLAIVNQDVEIISFSDKDVAYADLFYEVPSTHTVGTAGHDVIYLETAGDVAIGLDGNDYIQSVQGSPLNTRGWLLGGAGNDTLVGRDKNDGFLGGGGWDWIRDFIGSDTFFTEADWGVDVLEKQPSFFHTEWDQDRLIFQTGAIDPDELRATRHGDALILQEQGTQNAVIVVGQYAGNDLLVDIVSLTGDGFLDAGKLSPDTVSATDGDDILVGNSETGVIEGLAGDDILIGHGDTATLSGGDGDDTLRSLAGDGSTLSGGAGMDTALIGMAFDGAQIALEHGDLILTDEDDILTYRLALDIETLVFWEGELALAEVLDGLTGPEITGTGVGETLNGTAEAEVINAFGGADWIQPGGGNDTIDGGNGRDMLSLSLFGDSPGRVGGQFRVYLDMEEGVSENHDGSERIEFTNIERLTSTIYTDLVRGTPGDDQIRTLGDYDWIVATEGEDTYDGGTGNDMISFLEFGGTGAATPGFFEGGTLPPADDDLAGVRVDLNDPSNNTGLAANKTLISIERVTGSSFQDVFVGDDSSNNLRGMGGYDWFVASDGGRERYFGGNGVDTVTYHIAPDAITASLINGTPNDDGETGFGSKGWARKDLYFSIENLVGSAFDDSLEGSSAKNQLSGMDGDDIIFGLGGGDQLKGGLGDDTLNGGAGSDRAMYDFDRDEYTLTRTAAKTVTISHATEGTDSLQDVEYFEFADVTVDVWSLTIV